jgi:glutamine synthetase
MAGKGKVLNLVKENKTMLELIKEHDIQFVDFRFTDTKGKLQHTSYTGCIL